VGRGKEIQTPVYLILSNGVLESIE
jgi:hypothetical protein